jgi:hypothetical protein
MLRDTCEVAAATHAVAAEADDAARMMENLAVLLKQLCLVDAAAVEGVMSDLQQPAGAAAACVARWLAETRSMVEQQQRLDQQQRSIAAERLAVQQLVVAAAGTQRRVAAERLASEQRAGDVSSVRVEQFSYGVGAASLVMAGMLLGLLLPIMLRYIMHTVLV